MSSRSIGRTAFFPAVAGQIATVVLHVPVAPEALFPVVAAFAVMWMRPERRQ